MRLFLTLCAPVLAVLPSCALDPPECDFASISGRPDDASDFTPTTGVIETWSADTVAIRGTDGETVFSVVLPTATVDLGAEAVGTAVLVDAFGNLHDDFECGTDCFGSTILQARVTTTEGRLVLYATTGGGPVTAIDGAPACTFNSKRVVPGETALFSDDGDVVLRSGEQQVLTVEGQSYLAQDIASFVDAETQLPTSMVAMRAVFPFSAP